ncbi:hypothetical protein EV1_032908 [Malus domestica]
MMYNAGVEVGHLAARVLQKRDLEKRKLHELAAEVGIDDIKPQSEVLSLLSPADAKDFSEERYELVAGKLLLYSVSDFHDGEGFTMKSTLSYGKFNTGADLGDLAAKVLKNPNLVKCGLAVLASEVGFDIKPPAGAALGGICLVPDWNATALSEEQIKYAIHDVHQYLLLNHIVESVFLWGMQEA